MKNKILANFIFSILILSAGHSSYACSMCFYGSPQQPVVEALRMSVIFLLAIVILVLGAFAKFFININRREKRMSHS